MNYLGTIDYTIITVYLLFLAGMGLYLKKRASESIEDYIVGGNKIPWWAMGISGMANFLDLTGTALIISFLFLLGPQGLFLEFRGGVVLILAFMMLWTGKWHRRSGCLTGAEWNIFRFGDTFGGRFAQIFQVVGAVVGILGMVAYMIIGVGAFLSVFLPFSPMECAIGLIFVATLYTMVSGFYGVVFTDIFQSLIVVVAVIYISYISFNMIDDSAMMQKLAFDVTQNQDWINTLPKWKVHMPKAYEAYDHLILFAFFYLLRNVFGGIGSGADPKYFGAKNDRECGQLSFLWIVLMAFRWPLMMGITVMGIFLVKDLFTDLNVISHASQLIHTEFPTLLKPEWGATITSIANSPELYRAEFISTLQNAFGGADEWQNKLQLVGFDGDINAERILPMVIIMSIPVGMKGLVLVALIAASMSTFDSNVNLATGLVVRDIYQKYMRPKAKTKELIYCSWATVVLLVLGGFAFASSISSINDIWGWVVMGIGAGVLVPSILRLYWWRFNGGGYAVGTIFGLTCAILQRIYAPQMSEVWIFILVMSVGFIGCILGTYCTKPTDQAVLEYFYKKTRPFGFWAPVKHVLAEDVRHRMKREHRNDLISVPFVLTWQVSIFLAPMLLILHRFDSFMVVSGIALACLACIYYFWLRNLPKDNFEPELERELRK